jgi:hypothetical protein
VACVHVCTTSSAKLFAASFDLPAAAVVARAQFPSLTEADVAAHISLLTAMNLLDEDEESSADVERWCALFDCVLSHACRHA